VGRFRNPFSRKTVSFLRSLKKNNDREWFRSRRDRYETHVRGPMIAVVEQLAQDFGTFAPELLASPKHSLFRVYRDTRFSSNKKPLKTHAAAVFRTRDLPKPQGAGLYFEIAPGWVWIGGGMWRPEPPELVRIREHIAETWPEMHGITRAAAFRRRFDELSGDTMTRVPRGYPADHPAAAYLKYRQFYGGAEFPAALAHSRAFYPTLVATFKALMPLVRFLNEPLVDTAAPSLSGGRDAVFGLDRLAGTVGTAERLRGASRPRSVDLY
jgi:uncharacterized protein (TIGR02453 family)